MLLAISNCIMTLHLAITSSIVKTLLLLPSGIVSSKEVLPLSVFFSTFILLSVSHLDKLSLIILFRISTVPLCININLEIAFISARFVACPLKCFHKYFAKPSSVKSFGRCLSPFSSFLSNSFVTSLAVSYIVNPDISANMPAEFATTPGPCLVRKVCIISLPVKEEDLSRVFAKFLVTA